MLDHIFILVNGSGADVNFVQIDRFVPYSKLFNSRLRIG